MGIMLVTFMSKSEITNSETSMKTCHADGTVSIMSCITFMFITDDEPRDEGEKWGDTTSSHLWSPSLSL